MDATTDRETIAAYERALLHEAASMKRQNDRFWEVLSEPLRKFQDAERQWKERTMKARKRLDAAYFRIMERIEKAEYVAVDVARRNLDAAWRKAAEAFDDPLPRVPTKPKSVRPAARREYVPGDNGVKRRAAVVTKDEPL